MNCFRRRRRRLLKIPEWLARVIVVIVLVIAIAGVFSEYLPPSVPFAWAAGYVAATCRD